MTLRALPVTGALFCAASVGLGAYASHAASGQVRERVAIAALFAFAHGLALVVLCARNSATADVAKWFFFSGTLLFSGSLVAAAFLATPTGGAPFGGMLLIGGWLLMAVDGWRNPPGGHGPV